MTKPELTIFLSTFKEDLKLSADKLSKLRDDIYTLLLKNGELVPARALFLNSQFVGAHLEPKKHFSDFVNMVDSHFESASDAEKVIFAELKAICMMLNSDEFALCEYVKNTLILNKENDFVKSLIKNLGNDEYLKLCSALINSLKNMSENEQRTIIMKFREYFDRDFKGKKEIYALFLALFDEFIKAKNLEMSLFCATFGLYEFKEFYNYSKIKKDLSALCPKNTKKCAEQKHEKKRIGFFGYKMRDNDEFAYFYSLVKLLLKEYKIYFYECSNEALDALCMVELMKLGAEYKAPNMELCKKPWTPVLAQIDAIIKMSEKDEIDIAINFAPNLALTQSMFSTAFAPKMCNNFDIKNLDLPIDEAILNQKIDLGYTQILRKQFSQKSRILGSFSRKLSNDEIAGILEFLNENKDFIFITNSTQKFPKKPKNFVVLKDIDENAYLRICDFYLCDELDLNAQKVLANDASVIFSKDGLNLKNTKKSDFLAKTQKTQKENFLKSFLSALDA